MKLISLSLPYLLLVSFFTPHLSAITDAHLASLDASPFQGAAVPFVGPYDVSHHAVTEFRASLKIIRKSSRKHVWPWIFFNRIIGYRAHDHSLNTDGVNKHYFSRIRGIDINNEAGALDGLFSAWQNSLKIARELGSPGIVIDTEPYNNYRNDNISYVSEQVHEPIPTVISKLKRIGSTLADIAAREYPECTVWLLYSGLLDAKKPAREGQFLLRSTTYIIIGMLERTKEIKSAIKIVTGGELSLGYCFVDHGDLLRSIADRDDKYFDLLSAYPNLYLGATIAPWSDRSLKSSWMLKGTCGASRLEHAADFIPLLRTYYRHYDYIWIYAAKAAGYNPYDTSSAAINEVLSRSLQTADLLRR